MTAVSFTVLGTPKPQGSMRHVGRGILTHSGGQAFRDWRLDVTIRARQAIDGRLPLSGPVGVLAAFTLARPKSAPAHRRYPDKKPDLDKLARGLLDALEAAGVFTDGDQQVVSLTTTKSYPGGTLDVPGVVVTVLPLEEQ